MRKVKLVPWQIFGNDTTAANVDLFTNKGDGFFSVGCPFDTWTTIVVAVHDQLPRILHPGCLTWSCVISPSHAMG